MAIGIFGLPQTGKTTIFNAVTRGHAQGPGSRGGAQSNLRVVKVPDPRLYALAEIVRPKRIVHTEVEYIDVPAAPKGMGQTRGIGSEYLSALQRCEALLMVCRAFDDPSVAHAEESVDPYRDVANLAVELMFSDLLILERREERILPQLRSAKPAERDALAREQSLLKQLRESLEAEVPVRQQELSPGARPLLDNFQLLSAKPLMIVFNVNEEDVPGTADIEAEMAARLGRPGVATTALCGKLEAELAQMSPEDEAEFRESMGAGDPGLERMVRLSYDLLGLISFLTMGEDEARAWTVRQGTTAVEAAGKVHSDIQRGFIRAEVVPFEELVRTGNLVEARKQAVLRAEGKAYVVQDGDVINFLFNV